MPKLRIQLLGGFQLLVDGAPILAVNQPRLQAFLAYLCLRSATPQSRQHLAFTFWPDVTEAQARNNLRQALHQLRHALPSGLLHIDVNSVWLPLDDVIQLDVAVFEAAWAQVGALGRHSEPAVLQSALEQAVQLYSGDLLPGCYDDWIVPERERLRHYYLDMLIQLIALLEAQRDYRPALAYAQLLLQADTLREATYICLIRLHALNQDRAAALRLYRQGVALLQAELGVEPGAELRAAYDWLMRGDAGERRQHFIHATDSVPLIGRRQEWRQLQAVWHEVVRGRASFMVIAGEAGIGKTRLAEELLVWAANQGIVVARTRAYAAEGRLAYGAIAEWLRSDVLLAALTCLDAVWLSEIARLLPELLATQPGLTQPGPLTELWQRQRFYQALARGVLAVDRPLVLLFDDIQWCDQETLEWLHFLLRYAPSARLLIVGTLRVEEQRNNPALTRLLQALRLAGQLHEMALAPLDAAEVATLAVHVAGRALTEAESLRLFQESEGNPFFVTEMARADLGLVRNAVGASPHRESALQPDGETLLPPRVYAVIASRLGHLSPAAQELLGVAATIGRAFTVEVLAHVCEQDADRLVQPLDELWQRRIIREQGVDAYDFSHDKLRDVVYRELSPIQRRAYHRRVAHALVALHAADLDAVSARLAAHYEQAGFVQQALTYYERAAAAAQRVFAHEEACQLLSKGLALLLGIVPGTDRDERELALRTALGASLVALKGYGAVEVMKSYRRAYQLCEQLQRLPSPPVLRGLALTHIVQAESQQAYELGAHILDLARHSNDPVLFVEAQYVLGVSLLWQGEFRRSQTHLRKACEHYLPRHASTHLALYAQDPKVVCLIRSAENLWILGYPTQANRIAAEALAQARDLAHPFTLAYAAYYETHRLAVTRVVEHVMLQAGESVALCQEYQVRYWLVLSKICQGWALGMRGAIDAGIAQIQEYIAIRTADGTWVSQPLYLALLAELHSQAGNLAQALDYVAQAIAFSETRGERWYLADLYRLQGDLQTQWGDPSAAQQAYQRGLQIARQQEARMFELRLATSLARLWRSQGYVAQAGELLTPLYHWFTEGFDTPELMAARTLLDELGC